jgi:hypothetical protein
MTTISEHERDNEGEDFLLLDSPRESLKALSYDVERGDDHEGNTRWQKTRYKYKIFVLTASTVVMGLEVFP